MDSGGVRHPVFHGLEIDRKAGVIIREKTVHVKPMISANPGFAVRQPHQCVFRNSFSACLSSRESSAPK